MRRGAEAGRPPCRVAALVRRAVRTRRDVQRHTGAYAATLCAHGSAAAAGMVAMPSEAAAQRCGGVRCRRLWRWRAAASLSVLQNCAVARAHRETQDSVDAWRGAARRPGQLRRPRRLESEALGCLEHARARHTASVMAASLARALAASGAQSNSVPRLVRAANAHLPAQAPWARQAVVGAYRCVAAATAAVAPSDSTAPWQPPHARHAHKKRFSAIGCGVGAAAPHRRRSGGCAGVGGSALSAGRVAGAGHRHSRPHAAQARAFHATRRSEESKRDFYEVLGIDRTADKSAVKKAYYKVTRVARLVVVLQYACCRV